MVTRAETDLSYDPAARLGNRYGQEDRITTISPPLQQLLTACGEILQPGWEHRDTFHISPSWPGQSILSLVFENPSSLGRSGTHTFTEVVACLKPELRTFGPSYGVDGWVLPDTVVRPLSAALQSTYFKITQAELGFNPVRTVQDHFFQTGVLVFDLFLSDARTEIDAAELEFQRTIAHLASLRLAAMNKVSLF